MGDHPPSKQNRTQSLHFESNEGISAPPNPLSPAAAEEAACIAEDLLTDDGSGSAPITIDPGWPHGIQQTTLPGGVFRLHAQGPIRGLLPVFLPRVGRRGGEYAEAQDRS